MSDDNVVRVTDNLYQKAKEMAENEGITMSDAIAKLVSTGWSQPSVCELTQFRKVLEKRGLTPPSRSDWLWGITNILPADMLSGTKLEPYAAARHEAELRCSIGDQLYDRLFTKRSSEEAVEEAVGEPASLPEATKPAPTLPTATAPPEADAGGEVESSLPAKAEPAEVAEPTEAPETVPSEHPENVPAETP